MEDPIVIDTSSTYESVNTDYLSSCLEDFQDKNAHLFPSSDLSFEHYFKACGGDEEDFQLRSKKRKFSDRIPDAPIGGWADELLIPTETECELFETDIPIDEMMKEFQDQVETVPSIGYEVESVDSNQSSPFSPYNPIDEQVSSGRIIKKRRLDFSGAYYPTSFGEEISDCDFSDNGYQLNKKINNQNNLSSPMTPPSPSTLNILNSDVAEMEIRQIRQEVSEMDDSMRNSLRHAFLRLARSAANANSNSPFSSPSASPESPLCEEPYSDDMPSPIERGLESVVLHMLYSVGGANATSPAASTSSSAAYHSPLHSPASSLSPPSPYSLSPASPPSPPSPVMLGSPANHSAVATSPSLGYSYYPTSMASATPSSSRVMASSPVYTYIAPPSMMVSAPQHYTPIYSTAILSPTRVSHSTLVSPQTCTIYSGVNSSTNPKSSSSSVSPRKPTSNKPLRPMPPRVNIAVASSGSVSTMPRSQAPACSMPMTNSCGQTTQMYMPHVTGVSHSMLMPSNQIFQQKVPMQRV